MVTKAADSKGVTEPPASVASIRLKALRFDVDPSTPLFLCNSTDLWQLRGSFREGYSKRSSESAGYITIQLYSVSREISREKIFKIIKTYYGQRNFVVDCYSNAIEDSHPWREREAWVTCALSQWFRPKVLDLPGAEEVRLELNQFSCRPSTFQRSRRCTSA